MCVVEVQSFFAQNSQTVSTVTEPLQQQLPAKRGSGPKGGRDGIKVDGAGGGDRREGRGLGNGRNKGGAGEHPGEKDGDKEGGDSSAIGNTVGKTVSSLTMPCIKVCELCAL